MESSAPLLRSFVEDPALTPLVSVSSPVARKVPSHLGFYFKEGRFFGTDGLNHTPLNTAILSYFVALFESGIVKIGRGSAFFLLSGGTFGRRIVVTDHNIFQSTILKHSEGIGFLLSKNFHRDEPQPQS